MPLQDKLSNDSDGEQTNVQETSVRRILLFPFRFCVKKNPIKSILRRYVPYVSQRQDKHSETGGRPSVQVTKQVLLRYQMTNSVLIVTAKEKPRKSSH